MSRFEPELVRRAGECVHLEALRLGDGPPWAVGDGRTVGSSGGYS